MKTIRRGVFETNSSSCHSLTICTEDQFNKIGINNLIYNDRIINSKIIAERELINEEDAKLVMDALIQFVNNRKEFIMDGNYGEDPEYYINSKIEDEEECEAKTKQLKTKFSKYFALSDRLKEVFKDYDDDIYDIDSYEEYYGDCCEYELYSSKYKTPGGENIKAFGYYGYC